MSYGKIAAKIRTDALQDVTRRIEGLDRRLDEVEAAAEAPGEELERELRYLERMVAAAPPGDRNGEPAARIERLRQRFTHLVQQEAARAAHAVGPTSFSGVSSSTAPPPTRTLRPPVAAAEATTTAAEATTVSPVSPVVPVASFLRPEQTAEDGEDEVRLLAAEGRLAQELQRFPMLSVPGTDSTLVFRRVLRSWTAEDDERERQTERLAILELSQAAANVREMQAYQEQLVQQDQEHFDAIEQNVAETRRRVSEAVVNLEMCQTESERVLFWLAPSIGLVILGGGIISVAPAAAAGCAACVLVRGGIAAGALCFHAAGTYKLARWQKHVMESMTEHLPRVFDPLPAEEVKLLRGAGDEAQRRLLTKLADKASWSEFHTSPVAIAKGLHVFSRASAARQGGCSSSTSFTVKRIRARQAFEVVRQLSMSGSLDPGCEVAWSRPIDEQEEGTSLRYLIFSNWVGTRDFYCVCRAVQVDPPAPDAWPPRGESAPERFAFAVASLEPELLVSAGLPPSNKGVEHGKIHISGITLSDDGNDGTVVQVMADVDLVQSWWKPTYVVDSEVRLHVIKTAKSLQQQLKSARDEAAAGR